jgi:hypothetical protein
MSAIAASFAILTLAGVPGVGPDPDQGAVRLSLNGGDYQPGDRVRATVSTDEDGYLLVFRADADGYLRVLFPLDPDLDPFVRGHRDYELRGRGDSESFRADDRGGTGLIFAALTREPLNFSGYAAGMHWDYERLRLDDPYGDVEAQLLAIVRRMTDNGRFDHDAVGYRVWGPGYEQAEPTIVAGGGGYYDPYLDGRYSCLACGWGYPRGGIGVSIGVGRGWYDPWSDPWYHDYGRGHYGWNGFWGWDTYWGTPWRPITVINTYPRPTVPNAVYGTRSRPRQPLSAGAVVPRLGDPVRPQPRPVPANDGRSRRPNTTTASPPSRPSDRPASPAPSRGGTVTPSAPRPAPSAERSRSRRPNNEVASSPSSGVATPRTAEERPVYRPPVALPSRPDRRPEPEARPASSPPPRQAAPPRAERPTPRTPERSTPVRRESTPSAPTRSAPTRVERPAPSRAPERRSPPARVERPAPSRAPERRSPPARVERPSPPSPAPAGGASSPRSRSRGPDN